MKSSKCRLPTHCPYRLLPISQQTLLINGWLTKEIEGILAWNIALDDERLALALEQVAKYRAEIAKRPKSKVMTHDYGC